MKVFQKLMKFNNWIPINFQKSNKYFHKNLIFKNLKKFINLKMIFN